MMILKLGSDESAVLPVACDDDYDVVGVCLDDGHCGGFKFSLFIIVVGSGWSRKKNGRLLQFGCRD